MKPSFGYLDKLSGGNEKFKERIISILLKELPTEYKSYQNALESKNYYWASEIVHRIKQKITFLEMKESFKIADQHENYLREGKLIYLQEFDEIIHKILNFLSRTPE
ncbi:MAG: hypothetical protein LPK25_04555 [Cyclobacteriaceae bacterium]|nr:hypothetical protein [Cyclobacteriaceae bacterium]MDX5466025.1 hypothetical protein [Cyclobacteriaceae bacterium]